MSNPPFVPPLKCQGIKTKLVGEIGRSSLELKVSSGGSSRFAAHAWSHSTSNWKRRRT